MKFCPFSKLSFLKPKSASHLFQHVSGCNCLPLADDIYTSCKCDTPSFAPLTLHLLACMMTTPQVSRAIAVLRCRDRGKSALHRARRRIAPGAGNLRKERTCRKRATETNSRPHPQPLSHWERGAWVGAVMVKWWCKRPPASAVMWMAR